MNIEDVWLAYRARIEAFLRSKVSNPADVDDLLQEISIKVFRGLPSLDDRQKLQPWLFQIAHRSIIDFYRRSARARDIGTDDLWYREDDPETLNELERCVEPFIQALPPETARMLTAIDIDGMSQKDYAQAQEIAYSTLKSRLQKGRAELRRVFENCCIMSVDTRGNIMEFRSKTDRCEKC